MRRLRYSVAMSLDGYIAGPNGEADWILMDPDIDFGAIFAEFDTLLMGRKTFETTATMAGPSEGPFSGLSVVVVSRTLASGAHPKVRVIGSNLAQDVAALKAAPGKDIWLFGGGNLFQSLLAIGLVDRVEVAIIPVLLGGGIPLLPVPTARAGLTLASHRVYPKTGTVSLEYAVNNEIPRSPRRKTRR